jgi:shikimate dehydrogenase
MRIGLIGYPVGHSASPRMQGAAFAAAGLDWQYELWPTPLEELAGRMASIREDDGIGGANVTIPHKQNVVPYLDAISPQAQAIGAVNTIVKAAGRLSGDNTDWIGFLNDLRWHGIDPTKLQPAQALVLGAGGSARAIVYALASCGLRVNVANRDAGRASHLVAGLQPLFPSTMLRVHPLTIAGLTAASAGARLIVNCTSAGMSPATGATPWDEQVSFPAGAAIYDLVYKPVETLFMRQAQAAGLRAIGGIGMLAEQGAAAFERWTGRPAAGVAGVMRAALAT